MRHDSQQQRKKSDDGLGGPRSITDADEHVQSWSESLRQSGRLPTVDAIYVHEKGDLGDVMMVGVDEKE